MGSSVCVVIWWALLFMVLLTSLHTHAYFINIPSILDSYQTFPSFYHLLEFHHHWFLNSFLLNHSICVLKQVTLKLSCHAYLKMLNKQSHYLFDLIPCQTHSEIKSYLFFYSNHKWFCTKCILCLKNSSSQDFVIWN